MIIRALPTSVFQLNVSPKNMTENKMTMARLDLSIGATWDAFPIWSALK